jgi:hypothetical protein
LSAIRGNALPEKSAKKLAEEAARIIGEGLEKGEAVPDFQEIPRFEDYIRGRTDAEGNRHEGWINSAGMLKDSARESCRLIIESRLVPAFGNVRTDETAPRMIHNFVLSLFKEGLRSPTVRNIRNLSERCFERRVFGRLRGIESGQGDPDNVPADEVPSREHLNTQTLNMF